MLYDDDVEVPEPPTRSTAATKQAQLHRLQARVNFDPMPLGGGSLGHAARNSVVQSEKKASQVRNIGLTQDSRATVEQVLDPRTMLVLSKFLKRGVFSEVHGCVSTGKEANVYYATAPDGTELAVKVYKTSILVFKDRARYVEGEYRFRHGYCKGNPRKMVAQWAEKEMRNLKRLRAAGVPCPDALELRQNVLVMEFIGQDGDAAPRLKDAEGVTTEEWLALYIDCAVIMRRMMQRCKLVHGDLSEYNILHKDGSLQIIDVSQSVEGDHPQSLDFLKRDCVNINSFFGKNIGRPAVPVKSLFDYVVSKELPRSEGNGHYGPDDDAEAFQALLESAADGQSAEAELEDEVFVQTWIPSHLDQVSDRGFIERELDRRARGEEVLYERLLADGPKEKARLEEGDEDEEDSEEDSEEEEGGSSSSSEGEPAEGEPGEAEEGEDSGKGPTHDGHRPAGMDKHEWKTKVKEERREKRKEKVPKALKKKFRKQAAKGR